MLHLLSSVLARSRLGINPSFLPSDNFRAQELCESPGGLSGLPVPNSPYGLCGRKATLNSNSDFFPSNQELCESPG